MCGIAGIVSSGPVPELSITLRRMQDALVHRGPDGAGLWSNSDQSVGFAHRRLAIIDTSSGGHQPMSTPDGRFTIVFNGEIYNFRELRAELESSGVEFRSSSDTEVILRLYERFGKTFVRRLRGMFALAVWDNSENSCFLARDHLGIKPLYLSLRNYAGEKSLLFASEVRAIAASRLVSAKHSVHGALGYFRTGSVPEPFTIYEDIQCLPAGTLMTWKDGRIEQQRFWSLLDVPELEVVDTGIVAKTRLRGLLLDSVRAHHVSDVPVGIFLSGGIDSTAVLALTRAIGQKDIRTFSIAFREAAWDEGSIAKRTAAAFSTDHLENTLDVTQASALLGEFWGTLDQPTIDGFNTWCVSRLTSREGMKVVLSGLGGDELFGGYASFRLAPRMVRVASALSIGRHAVGWALEHGSSQGSKRRAGEFLQSEVSLPNAWGAVKALFTWEEARALTGCLLGLPVDQVPSPEAHSDDPVPSWSDARKISYLETTRYMRNQLLRDSDVMSMSRGLELRVPLVDSILVEKVYSEFPTRHRTDGKELLIEAVPEIPAWVKEQPKRGFQFPFEAWAKNEWSDMFSQAEISSPVPLKTWYHHWCVLAFQAWSAQATARLGS